MNVNLLLTVLVLPLLGMLAVVTIPKDRVDSIRRISLLFSGLTFIASLGLLAVALRPSPVMQFEVDLPWISSPSIHFHLGVDGISVWLILLSTLLTPISVLMSWKVIDKRQKEFHLAVLLLEFALIGVFAALDLFLFYSFFELTLVPSLMMIGIWGGERRMYAAMKFFLYTLAGSILMLAGIIYIYAQTGTGQFTALRAMVDLGQGIFPAHIESWVFLSFFVAFAVKLALVPLHTWLPDAYDEAPTAAPMMLSAVMMKMGTYGLIRFAVPLFPVAARHHAGWIVALAILSIIYGALVAMVQPNLRRLVGFSSISHIGFIVLGIFTFTQVGLDGAVYLMVAHGVSTGAIFVLLGFLYERRRSMEIKDFGGLVKVAPGLSTAFMIAALASIGLPSLSNFVGEYLVLQGAAEANFTWAALAAIGVILSACYMLWMYQRVFLGDRPGKAAPFADLDIREWVTILPLLALTVYLGVAANSLLPAIGSATSKVVEVTKTGIVYQARQLSSEMMHATK